MSDVTALLYCAGGGIGDSLVASVVARALRSRFGRVDALTLPGHRSTLERVCRSRRRARRRRRDDRGTRGDRSRTRLRRVRRDLGNGAHGARPTARGDSRARRAGATPLLASLHRPRRRAQRTRRRDVALGRYLARLCARHRLRYELTRAIASCRPNKIERDAGSLIVELIEGRFRHPSTRATRSRRSAGSGRWRVGARSRDALREVFGCPVLLSGAPADARSTTRSSSSSGDDATSIAGALGIGAFGALAARARAFVGITTGSMHVAAAVGAPTVGIFPFQSDFPERWAPLGARTGVVRASYPCHRGDTKETCRGLCLHRKTRRPAHHRRQYRLAWSRAIGFRCARPFNSAPITAPRCSSACSTRASSRPPAPATYEVVLVNDGSTDDTPAVIERARARATCRFEVINQANSGLAKGRNAGIARASGERIIFIDDDVLPLPNFVEEHLRRHARTPQAIVRGGAINVENFDDLPPPVWSIRDYSGNYLLDDQRLGAACDDSRNRRLQRVLFRIRLGRYRRRAAPALRAACSAVFNPKALVYHYKPRPRSGNVEKMVRASARASAHRGAACASCIRTGAPISRPGSIPLQRGLHAATRRYRKCGAVASRRLGDLEHRSRALEPRTARGARARDGTPTSRSWNDPSQLGARSLKILLSRTDRIGDLILSTPAIATVRASFPDAHVTMVTSPLQPRGHGAQRRRRRARRSSARGRAVGVRRGAYRLRPRDRARAALRRPPARSVRRARACASATRTSGVGLPA